MIIWLASYPRSGNTLLRTIFKQSMGLESYSDENDSSGFSKQVTEAYGGAFFDSSWDSFYRYASNSKKIFLVKTHQPPRDSQPVIYVVRDGRSAIESYVNFHKDFVNKTNCPSIMQLIIGDDYYGNWSSHYLEWSSRVEGELMLLRFEELGCANSQLLERIGLFINFEGEIRTFNNPLKNLNLIEPKFFRASKTVFERSSEWTEELEMLFIVLHGDLLIELDYISSCEKKLALQKIDPMTIQLVELASQGYTQRNYWHLQAQEKERAILELLNHSDSYLNKAKSYLYHKCVKNFGKVIR